MNNWIFRLVTALLAFTVGVLSSQLRSSWQRKVAPTEPSAVLAHRAKPLSVETWRKVVIKDRFSFYIPPYLEEEGKFVERHRAIGGFRKPGYGMGGLYYLSYYAGYDTEDDLSTSRSRYKWNTRFDVMFGRKRAVVVTEIPSREEITCIHDLATVDVYFPDIGGDQKLNLRFASGDAEGIQVAKRILESMEFVR